MYGAFSSPVLLSLPELVPMTSGLCKCSTAIHGHAAISAVGGDFLPFKLIKNALYREHPQARNKVDFFLDVYDKAQDRVGMFMWTHQKDAQQMCI